MNAYVTGLMMRVGDREPLEILSATPHRLEELAAALGEAGLSRSLAPGKWTARGILAHVAECELAFGFRFRQVLAENHHRVQPFDQDAWARRNGHVGAREALDMFGAVRAANVALLGTVAADDWMRVAHHPERGEETLAFMARYLAGHDLNHLEQLEALAGR